MKKSRFTESQIVAILKEGEAGVAVAQLTRKHGISAATYYHWKSKYGGEVSRSSNGCVSWRRRTPSSGTCMPIWRWRIPRSRTCLAENSDAVGQAGGDPRDDL
jgi:transposase-like protein